MITPKFNFNGVNFTPTWPPVKKRPITVNKLVAIKHDSVASAGNKQSNTERIEEYQPLEFPFVPVAELTTWRQLIIWGMNGGLITYYPDSTDAATYISCWLEDLEWDPLFVMPGFFSFTITLRNIVEASYAGS